MNKIIKNLPPSAFAITMATGIIATASQMQHHSLISALLFLIGNVAFVVLLCLLFARLFTQPSKVAEDIGAHAKGAGFLTIVAAACVLGSEYAQAKASYGVALALWIFSGVSWIIIIYSFLASVILKSQKPSPETGMNGSWLLVVVSTQALSILGSALRPGFSQHTDTLTLLSLLLFLLGTVFYLLIITIDFYRLIFYPMLPKEVVPSYWINMGAAAISSLAGIMLSQSLQQHPLFGDFNFLVKALSVLFWCIGTFWIPLIVVMEIWRYGKQQQSLQYEAGFWSLVFPLGMYSVSSGKLSALLPFSFFTALAHVFLYVAWTAWLLTFAGLCLQMLQLIWPKKNERINDGS